MPLKVSKRIAVLNFQRDFILYWRCCAYW